MSPLVLASASPRRRALLEEAGIDFAVAPSGIDEDLASVPDGARPDRIACAFALRKALARARLEPADARVLAADTIVVAPGGALLGKPADAGRARSMLEGLSGRTHRVVTGVALLRTRDGAALVRAVESSVRFRYLQDDELDRAVVSGLWRDKAGAYGVQDDPSLVDSVSGSRTNVIGLPMETLAEMLKIW